MKKIISILIVSFIIMTYCFQNGEGINSSVRLEWWVKEDILYFETQEGLDEWTEERRPYKYARDYDNVYGRLIKKIVIQKGITEIPADAFWDMEQVEKIEIPDTLKTIGENAFCGCLQLQEITLPDSIEDINLGAFLLCESLTEITIPPKVERLRGYIFSGCTGLKEIYVPKTVKWIEEEGLLAEGAQRIVFEGTIDVIENLMTYRMPNLSQVVFLEAPPGIYEYDHSNGAMWPFGLSFLYGSDATIYYLNSNKAYWEEFGEEWLGCPLVGIDSMDDLPPLD